MTMSDAEAARKMNGKLSWYDRRETILRAFGLWDHYGQVPPYDDRADDHRAYLPGGEWRD